MYGENTSGGGFGLAGRAGSSGHAVYGDNTGSGFAGYFEDKVHIGGSLDCSGCVGASDLSETYVKGSGSATGQALAVTPGANTFLGPPLNGFLRLSYFCPSPTSNTGFLWVYNDSGSVANVFIESGDANPTYRSMAAGANFFVPGSPAGDSWHIQAQGAPGVQTIEVATVHRPAIATRRHGGAHGLTQERKDRRRGRDVVMPPTWRVVFAGEEENHNGPQIGVMWGVGWRREVGLVGGTSDAGDRDRRAVRSCSRLRCRCLRSGLAGGGAHGWSVSSSPPAWSGSWACSRLTRRRP